MTRRRNITSLELAVVEVARAWAAGGQPEAVALLNAVNGLEGAHAAEALRCKESGIIGDASWPHAVSCVLRGGHVENGQRWHEDPTGVQWGDRA